jgi:pimeloyl-ACP methyl ester carboxylesterase/predicted enzyme related to lactoylglutathione lyase
MKRGAIGSLLLLFLLSGPQVAAQEADDPRNDHGIFTGEIKPVLYVTDVERSAPFYRDVLGFDFQGFANLDGKPYYAEMVAAGTKFGLHEPTSEGQESMVGRQRLYFRVEDLQAHRSRVSARGGEPGEIKTTSWMDMFVVRDPDGNEIVFAVTDPERHSSNPWRADPPASVTTEWPHMVESADGVPISYEVHGSGEPTLVFVHGWCCDARYWRAQVPYFSKTHRVVTLDLAGHGHSGAGRSQYTMPAFGEDVRAVAEAAGGEGVILIGHSMGGSVIAEAARLMPKRVVGLIGIDTLENIEYPLTTEQLEGMIAPLEKDFPAGSRQFLRVMISPHTDSALREWILSDASAEPPAVALSAMKGLMSQYITGEAAAVFDEIRVPVVTVNGDQWPINYEANRRHMFSYDAIVLKDAGHFLMMARPGEFNSALEQAINTVLGRTPEQTGEN